MYVPSGHLAYIAGGALWAVPFDRDRLTTSGRPVPMLKDVVTTGNGAGIFDVSPNGTLAYGHASGFDPFARTLSWIDRQGKIEPTGAPPHPYSQPKNSMTAHGWLRAPCATPSRTSGVGVVATSFDARHNRRGVGISAGVVAGRSLDRVFLQS